MKTKLKAFEDPANPGNSAVHHTGGACVESGCNEPAGTAWGPYWCFKHNVERMSRISKQLQEISASYKGSKR